MPSVSVVIPVLNGADTIGDMLAALTNQAGAAGGVEVLVVDGGSTDATCRIVNGFPVTLLEEPKRGPAAARNCGLRQARGEVIAHLDADTVPSRSWVREIISPFTDPNVVLVGGRTLPYQPETPAERYFARSELFDTAAHLTRKPFAFVPSLNMAVRYAAAMAVDGWREELITAEDVDFSYRLLQRFPGGVRYHPQAVLFHRNRRTDDALRRQAWTYGEGVAHMYELYPELLHWTIASRMHLRWTMTRRAAAPFLRRAGALVGLTSGDDVEFAQYHWLWTRWFWRGFFSYRRHHAYR